MLDYMGVLAIWIMATRNSQSSPTGTSSSKYLTNFTRISVVSSPRRTSDTNSACTCIWTLRKQISNENNHKRLLQTISKAPRITPHRTLLNQSPPSRASSGNSTKSANGFSSNVNVNDDPTPAWPRDTVLAGLLGGADGGMLCVTLGAMFKKDLKPTYLDSLEVYLYKIARSEWSTLAITSPVSLKSLHLPRLDLARKSSINRVPMLYPIFSSCLLTSS